MTGKRSGPWEPIKCPVIFGAPPVFLIVAVCFNKVYHFIFFFLLVAVGFPVAVQSVSYFNFSAALRSLRSVDITLCPAAGRDFYVSTLTLKEWEDGSSFRVPVSNL